MLSLWAFKFSASITSFEMLDRKERVLPFFFISIIYCLPTYLFYTKIKVNNTVLIIFATISILLLLLTIITIFWKISLHSTGISGMIGFIVAINIKYPDNDLIYPLIILILLAGAVMSSRLYLNCHRPEETFGGSIFGFLLSFGAVYFFT